ncbi:MAG: hypothetical protein AMXMBFR84_26150 [Candidatus Hydrogenedentota bacterium]
MSEELPDNVVDLDEARTPDAVENDPRLFIFCEGKLFDVQVEGTVEGKHPLDGRHVSAAIVNREALLEFIEMLSKGMGVDKPKLWVPGDSA